MSDQEDSLLDINDLAFPLPEEQLPFTGERYTSGISGPIRHQHHHRYLFATRFCSGLDVLDVACGEGYGSALLSTVARSVVGVDLHADTVAFAERNYAKANLSFRQGDAAQIQDKECFDIAVSFETIEHLGEHESFLNGLKRALRPGGLLIISSPDKNIYTDADNHENEFHLKELDRSQFKSLMGRYFENVAILEQDSVAGSLINLEAGTPAGLEVLSSGDGRSYHRSAGAPRAHYLIAIASDRPLPQIFASALNDMSWSREQQGHQAHAVSLAREVVVRDAEINRLQGEVEARRADVGSLKAEVERETAARDAEIGRLQSEAAQMATRILDLQREIDQSQAIVDDHKRHIAELLNSTSWRLSAPIRKIGRITAATGRRIRALRVPAPKPGKLRRSGQQPRIVFIDWTVPTPDQDSGSLDLWHQLRLFQAIGYNVSFMSIVTRATDRPYADALGKANVNYIAVAEDSSPEQMLQQCANEFDLIILNRIHVAERLLAHLRRCAPNARLVFNTVDLHFLREEREAALLGSQEKAQAAAQRRSTELRCMEDADATIVLSEEEGRMLAQQVPQAAIHVIPFARAITSHWPDFSQRTGVLFVGGFLHAPNVDGVIWLAQEIWPMVRSRLPNATLDIVGSNATQEIRQLNDPESGVCVHGFMQDLDPALARARLTVAPLRFGAGIKGKVAMSLAAGVPCVATPVASEGMGLLEDQSILVGRNSEEFAALIVRLHEDAQLWSKLSEGGKALMRSRYSFESVGNLFVSLLKSLDLTVPPGAEARITEFDHQLNSSPRGT